MSVQIREAKVEDAHAIFSGAKEIAKTPGYFCSLPNELSEENVIKTISVLSQSRKGIYLVAEQHGEIVGHAFLEPLHLKSICHVVQLTIGVYRGWQEKGIGTTLMQKIIEGVKHSQTIEKIELHVRATNIRAIGLYKKMGFVEEGRLKKRIKIDQDYYIDDILMALIVK